MYKNNSLLINTIIIVIGGALLIYAFSQKPDNKYLEIVGLVVIMFGLYRATNSYSEEEKNED